MHLHHCAGETGSIGGSAEHPSIFPDPTVGAIVLSIVKAVRSAEGIDVGSHLEVTVETVE